MMSWAEKAKADAENDNGRWAEYAGFWNSCVDFTWAGLNAGGLVDAPESGWNGNVFPWFNRWAIAKDLLGQDAFLNDLINDAYTAARSWVRRDPLALDLDGDGIETVGAAGSNVVLFDHDGDGTRTGTGWVKADDGWLVMDRNGNGTIDTGAELFGVDTVLANGQQAPDGFSALRDLDSNADGLFNAQDAQFTNVRVWRDLNQDGLSQANELTTLDQQGITGISLTAQAVNQMQPDGNVVALTSTYTQSTTDADGLPQTGNAYALNLVENPFYRDFGTVDNPFDNTFTDTITITDQAATLPEMNGSGMVRNLREAASLSPELAAQLATLTGTQTRAQLMGQMDGILGAWAGSSVMAGSVEQAAQQGIPLYYLPPGATPSMLYNALTLGEGNVSGGLISPEEAARREALMQEYQRINRLIEVLEKFNGQAFVTVGQNSVTTGAGQLLTSATSPSAGGGGVAAGTPPIYVPLSVFQVQLLEKSYAELKASVYDGLAMQTRLKPYLDLITLRLDDSGIHADFTALNAQLEALHQADPYNGLIDRIELVKNAGEGLGKMGREGRAANEEWERRAA